LGPFIALVLVLTFVLPLELVMCGDDAGGGGDDGPRLGRIDGPAVVDEEFRRESEGGD